MRDPGGPASDDFGNGILLMDASDLHDDVWAVDSAGTVAPSVDATKDRDMPTSLHGEPPYGPTFGQRYHWLGVAAMEPIDLTLFDARSQNAFRRGNIRTWGQLAGLTDERLAAIPNVGALTVQRINHVVATHRPSSFGMTGTDGAVMANEDGSGRPPSGELIASAAALYGLVDAAAWSRIVTGDDTLAGLLDAYSEEADVPAEVVSEVERFLATRLSHEEQPDLADLIDALLSEASDPDLLFARECCRVQPTLEVLGAERGITREGVRQKVVRDATRIQANLGASRYQALRWAVERLQAELGLMAPASSAVVGKWSGRIGERRFQFLRWLAGYVYNGDWIAHGRKAVSTLTSALDKLIGDAWLVQAEDLKAGLDVSVAGDTAVEFLLAAGAWRDIGDGWIVRWDGPIQVKAERILRLTCRPMTPAELVEAIGSGSEGSIKNQRGSRLVRIDKQFRLALSDWGYEEYGGITNEIDQRIERGGGTASVSAIIAEFVQSFGVTESSVRTYLESGPYVLAGDEVRHLEDRGYNPANVLGRRHAVRVGESWGQRFTVEEANLSGYSFGLDRDIAAHNGIQPDDSLIVPALNSEVVVGEASIIWRLTNLNGTVDVGRLSSALKHMGVEAGAELVLVPTPSSCTIFRPNELPSVQPRSKISSEVKQSILGRR